jgi:hypothetical protein
MIHIKTTHDAKAIQITMTVQKIADVINGRGRSGWISDGKSKSNHGMKSHA